MNRVFNKRLAGACLTLWLGALVVVNGGCASGVTVTAFDQDVITASRQNAQAIHTLAKADPEVPAYVSEWLEVEVQQWQALESWSRGAPVSEAVP